MSKGVAEEVFLMWKKLEISFTSYELLQLTVLLSVFASPNHKLHQMLPANNKLGAKGMSEKETPLTVGEQKRSGLRSLSVCEMHEFDHLNEKYLKNSGSHLFTVFLKTNIL